MTAADLMITPYCKESLLEHGRLQNRGAYWNRVLTQKCPGAYGRGH